jgi:cytidylate kinase
VIAIDGPVASGKTTVGKLVAERLGYRFVDTGQMYRALTWLALYLKIDPEDAVRLSDLAVKAPVSLSSDTGRVAIQDHDVTAEIYTQEVDAAVSPVSAVPDVRKSLVQQQRQIAEGGEIVMVGRDVSTVVLPESGLKVFLTAPAEERARRRYRERGAERDADYGTILKSLVRRDEIDSHRAVAPLRPAPDAHIVETEALTADQVADRIVVLAEQVS